MMTDVRKIEVLFRGTPAGVVQMDPSSGVCVFEYAKSWLSGGF